MLPKTIFFITTLVIGSGVALDAASAKTVVRSSDANKQIKSGGQPKTTAPADNNYEEGVIALKARDFKKAERCFQAGLKLDPNSIKCNLGMAKTEQQWRSDHDIAIWYLDKALAQEPKLVEAIKLRGVAYGAKRNYRKAIEDFNTLIAMEPTVVEYLCLRGIQYFDAGRIALARQDMAKGYTANPKDPTALLLRAKIEYYDCRYKLAESACSLVLQQGIQNADLYQLRSWAKMRLYDFAGARADLKLAESVGPYSYPDDFDNLADFEYDHLNAEKDPARRFMLACSATMFEFNTQGFESLTGRILNSKNVAEERRTLKSYWGITNRDELLRMIESHSNNGHNQSWRELRKKLPQIPSTDTTPKVKLMRKYGDKFGDRGILAWDLSRNISLCRWGCAAGYIGKDEAFELMRPFAKRIQKAYSGWKQFVTEYFIGREFWNDAACRKDRARMDRTIHRLISDPGGLNKVPWNTPL
ncbi:MAG: DUF1266 domain-containing protein [Candidatus Melainabacteria bacterium]|nr:DUF1266 domain-containing protein [Candidatus Melainabacteria bacterium]